MSTTSDLQGSLLRQRILVFLIPLLLALPFLNRAYFVDDSYFVEIATWLAKHPGLPYHFRADDAGLQNRGWEENGFVRMVNPLAHHYYLALLIRLAGAREWFLRFGCVLLSCFSALFLFEFARRWTNSPFLATALILVTPVHWLSSYSLLIDPTMAFFAFGGLYFFIRAAEVGSVTALIVSGVMMGLAILSKYPAIFILPLSGTWLYLRRDKIDRLWIYFLPWLIACAALMLYSLWTAHLYGQAHILAASARMVHVVRWPKILVFFAFLSGGLLIPLMGWRIVSLRIQVWSALAVFTLALFFSSARGGFSFHQGFLLALWLITSFIFIGSFWLVRSSCIYPRDHFLLLWVLGFIAMMLLVMDWVAVRYFCLVVPAVAFIGVRMVELHWPEASERVLKRMIVLIFVFTALLAYADYQQAEPSRLVGTELRAKGFTGGDRHFYLGDSFTMSYLKNDGWVPCFPDTTFQVGDLILAKEVTMPLVWFVYRPIVIREVARFEYPSNIPLKVMDYEGSAGFYASVWGALPFTFSTGPWERFRLFEVVALKSHDAV